MKKLMIALICLCALASAAGAEQWLGICADEAGTEFTGQAEPFKPLDLYFIAHVPEETDGILGIEFRVDEWMDNPGYPVGIFEFSWATYNTIGDLFECFGMIWTDPQYPDANGNILCGDGSITSFTSEAPLWPGESIVINILGRITGSQEYPYPRIVTPTFVTHDVSGTTFTLNIKNQLPTQVSSFSGIKALY